MAVVPDFGTGVAKGMTIDLKVRMSVKRLASLLKENLNALYPKLKALAKDITRNGTTTPNVDNAVNLFTVAALVTTIISIPGKNVSKLAPLIQYQMYASKTWTKDRAKGISRDGISIKNRNRVKSSDTADANRTGIISRPSQLASSNAYNPEEDEITARYHVILVIALNDFLDGSSIMRKIVACRFIILDARVMGIDLKLLKHARRIVLLE